ncbi:MAG: extracellular solute-binding protein, partial [Rhodobacterales bacterium]
MKFTSTVVATAALSLFAGSAFAGSHMASEMTIVSWGGAYSKSQLKAYHEPYSVNTGTTIINDDSAGTAVPKLRAMNEAGNITWDLVDVEAGPAMQLCDEGLAMEIDHDSMLADAPDGTPASEDFGDFIVSECFIPQIVYSYTMGYRNDMVGSTPPTSICAIFDTETYPGKRSLKKG